MNLTLSSAAKILLLLGVSCLNGCAHEQNYRGVPAPIWADLSAEQKQLIVDRAYADEMKTNN